MYTLGLIPMTGGPIQAARERPPAPAPPEHRLHRAAPPPPARAVRKPVPRADSRRRRRAGQRTTPRRPSNSAATPPPGLRERFSCVRSFPNECLEQSKHPPPSPPREDAHRGNFYVGNSERASGRPGRYSGKCSHSERQKNHIDGALVGQQASNTIHGYFANSYAEICYESLSAGWHTVCNITKLRQPSPKSKGVQQ